MLEHPGVIKDVTKLRESWNQTFGGTGNAGKVAILEEGLHFKPITMSPQDSQLLETRQYQLNEIARIFRIPPHMLLTELTVLRYLKSPEELLLPRGVAWIPVVHLKETAEGAHGQGLPEAPGSQEHNSA